MDTTKYRVGKTFISRTNPEDAIARVTEAALNGQGGYICVSNMRMIQYAGEHPEYNQLMKDSFMNWPDGRPLSWCGRMWGLKEVKCTSGPSTFMKMMSNPNPQLKHFLLGDTQDVLDEIVTTYRDAGIVGTYSLPFVEVNEFDYAGIAKMVEESGANVIWTAMTAPKQDVFNQELCAYLPHVVMIGVGRAFRISIGKVKDAPEWAKKMGVGGMYIGRKSKPQLLWWYIKKTFVLLSYYCSILWSRLVGKKYYE
jgi:N-acetylglucosaminyldiphosphoundecaprenol N-acetyl-beta-D-mannosaminyltransferase